MNSSKLRMKMLLALDFEQTDSKLIARAKQAIRNASEDDLMAAFEASKAERSFASAIRDTAISGGLAQADVAPLVGQLAYQGIV